MFALRCFGVVSIVALFCINRSLKLAPASVVVPYQYTMIVWAIAARLPGVRRRARRFTLIGGSAIIVAAGLYIFWREQVVARRGADLHAAAVAPFTPSNRKTPDINRVVHHCSRRNCRVFQARDARDLVHTCRRRLGVGR